MEKEAAGTEDKVQKDGVGAGQRNKNKDRELDGDDKKTWDGQRDIKKE